MQLKSVNLIILLVALLLVQDIKAQLFCEFWNTCTSTTVAPGASSTGVPSVSSVSSTAPMPSVSSSAPPVETSSSIVPSSSSIIPSSSSSKPPVTSSSATPSSSAPPMTSTTASSTSSTVSTTSPSASASATPKEEETSGGSNIGVIVGSVCGFVAIIGAGFAYAFFSKTRRNNRRNKRLYSDNGELYDHHNSYQPDQFNNARPSPALAASAIAAADDIHHNSNNHGQWEMAQQQPYGYNNTMMSPQPPMAAVAKQHDPYYNSPQMGYAVDPNMASNNYYNGQAYYDPNAGYQQQQQQHYDQHYAEPQYDPYAVQQQQHQSPVMHANMASLPALPQQNAMSASSTVVGSAAAAPIVTTKSNVYQTPHSYPEDNQKTSAPTNTNNEGSYR